MPAPAVISPVGCSSTLKFIIFKLSALPSNISYFAFLKSPLDLIFAKDFSKSNFENGSPSSTINSPLMTSSLVMLLPITLIRSTRFFFPSNTFIKISISLPSFFSWTLCSINCKLFLSIKSSNSCNIFFILKWG